MNAMQAYVVEDMRGVKMLIQVHCGLFICKVLIYIACNVSCFQIGLRQLFLLDIPIFHYLLQDSNDLNPFATSFHSLCSLCSYFIILQ
jgi:hypothetical protein